ncbi:MAG: phosphoenolpyruvate carboxylase [Pseudomonadota bacterium]|nr:phosphoenolpyruvate carboxylase [Pseudomonadota bacterium]MDE3038248.1 phosphoenolpyruvate carboxylase [Pseudomonadota bacterium]
MTVHPFPRLQKQLWSIDQREVAMALSDIFIGQIEAVEVRGALKAIRDIVWAALPTKAIVPDYDRDSARRNQDMLRIQALLEDVPDASKKTLADAYVRLGHLYEIAGHAARENFFRARERKLGEFNKRHPGKIPSQDIVVPGGVHDLLFRDEHFKDKPVTEVVQTLSRPVSEYVFTQHPTNTNTPESMRLQREIADAIDRVTDKVQWISGDDTDWQRLNERIARYAECPVVQDGNFTAYDETNIVINFLTNAYHDIDRLYEVMDRGLNRKFPDGYDDGKRWELDLKQRFSSWGSAGDKDGNNNITSEHTLEAIILHKKRAATLLLESLNKTKALPEWKEKLKIAVDGYTELERKIETVRAGENDIPLSNAQFDEISGQAQKLSRDLGSVENFLDDVKNAAVQASDGDKETLLAIHRKARIFGFSLGKIEYRETAEEYGRVVRTLMAYAKGKEEFKQFITSLHSEVGKDLTDLSEILRSKDTLRIWAAIASSFMGDLKGEDLRKYVRADDKSASAEEKAKGDRVIAYHTLRRMELARDFDDMITHNVLAECKGTSNLLEALALQVATTTVQDGKEKRALMHIVPLFEEADTMKRIPEVLKEGLINDAYRGHLETLQEKEKTPHLVQQVQIAHSDNARRAGSIASRGIIHAGHHAARAAVERYNGEPENPKVDLQFFEGGSQSDSYRNGVRAVTAVIKDFRLGDFAKMTFQGGDLLNYFNEPTSSERLMLRSIVEQAKLLNNAQRPNGEQSALEKVVVTTIEKLQQQYDQDYYGKTSNPIGKILHALGYRKQAAAGSAGTRGNRTIADYAAEKIDGVNARDVRTIGFSETLQHGGLHPACLGTKSLENDLSASLQCDRKATEELEKGFKAFKHDPKNKVHAEAQAFNQGQLTAAGLKYIYKTSPTFRDAVDKMAYSLLNTRVCALTDKLERYQQTSGKARDKTLDDTYRDKTLDDTYEEVLREYKGVGDLAYKALTGQEISSDQHRRISHDNNPAKALDRTITMLKEIEKLEHYEPLHYKHRFVDGLDIIEKAAGLENSRLTHNARDTLYHGRTFVADDPNYGQALTQAKEARRQENRPSAGL